MGFSKKWLLLILIVIACIAAIQIGRYTLNDFKRAGTLSLEGLTQPVRVLRDEKGMPYIYAQNEHDLFFAQGFVTAQDRLFNMELIRMIATGRLSEAFGEAAKASDVKNRTIGFHRHARTYADLLDETERSRFQAYVDGLNSFLLTQQDDLPFEMKLVGIVPEKWEISDMLAIVYYMGWGSSANLSTEIITQRLIDTLGIEKARQLFPVNVNPDDPSGEPLDTISKVAVLPRPLSKQLIQLLPETLDQQLKMGSNNWVVSGSYSRSGKPMLANDPHLDATILPGPFYPIGLILKGHRAVGATIPGVPGIVVGRTDNIAFGVTNGYGDAQDLYVETLYSENPDQYMEGDRSHPLEIIEETLKIKDKDSDTGFREETIQIRLTRRGPIVSDIFEDLPTGKVFSLRWAPFESKRSRTGLLDLMFAKDVTEARQALKNVTAIMLNFVIADQQGNIAWQTSGRIPLRETGDGTIPKTVTDRFDNWQGWIPWDEMPHSINPEKGWVGTANHTTITGDYPYYFSSYFAPSWRYRRLKELLASSDTFTMEDHWQFQRDTRNLMAERTVPIMVEALQRDAETSYLAEILSSWDLRDDPDKVGPTVYQEMNRQLIMALLTDELGEELISIYANSWYYWQERLVATMEKGQAEWFDDIGTADQTETLSDIIIRAGHKTINTLSDRLGSNPNRWKWGKAHQIEFVSILRQSGFGRQLIGGGSYPMPGSCETLYRGIYPFDDPYDTKTSAALRMVVDLADPDKIMAVLPGGVSARILDAHRTNQIKDYMDGTPSYWWFSDTAIEKNMETELMLQPRELQQ